MLERFTQCLFSPIILFLTLICSLQSVNKAQDQTSNEKILRTIANAIIEDATFEFADTHTGKHFKSTKVVPDSCKLKLASRYNDWRYWNGIINIALLKLANELNEPLYKEYSLENIAFTFDNYKYFEKNYNDEGKWNYPFGEFFIMEELDDCGAMGANVIEVYKLDPQERYKEYIDKAANHILNKQSQLEDRTLVRSFPHMWTLWADDLYMGISFLSRMGELTGDQ